eukprot:TRINITY_DN4558_c0_g1_i3.p1 TRINITY_DN4558_c0_g1~~TRINITY_DN4558_c0_g1_i3.p1  ORF type:complete len:296 (-),score=29.95 TRINITY_DN4558_c0_g1_i3:295-1161(-)
MQAAQWGREFPSVRAPLDPDGFIQSFSLEEVDQYVAFFRQYGFCAIANVLTPAETEATICDIWDDIEMYFPRRNEPKTWDCWPGLSHLGIQGTVCGEQVWRNRVNPKLYEVFRNLLRTSKLWVSADNCGVMRPTRNVPWVPLEPAARNARVTVEDLPDGIQVEDKPGWRSKEKWLHWDMNPFKWFDGDGWDYAFEGFVTENNGARRIPGIPKVQGLINLVDAREQDGGFITWNGQSRVTFRSYRVCKGTGLQKPPKEGIRLRLRSTERRNAATDATHPPKSRYAPRLE